LRVQLEKESGLPQTDATKQLVSAARSNGEEVLRQLNLVMQELDQDRDEWKAQYRFKLNPYEYSDFAERCKFHQTSPESHFTQNRICSLLTPNGRISVSDTRFIVSENGVRRDHPVASQSEYEQLLRSHFGIVL